MAFVISCLRSFAFSQRQTGTTNEEVNFVQNIVELQRSYLQAIIYGLFSY